MKRINNLKKSQILLIGSFLILVGIYILFNGYFERLKEEIYEDFRLSFIKDDQVSSSDSNKVTDSEGVSNLDTSSSNSNTNSNTAPKKSYQYIGYLEIPKIKLKRGFLNKDSKYNNIEYNIMVSYNADYPDVVNGNFILVAHSGDAYISFFAYLYKLKEGDKAYVTYGGNKYTYQLVKIEEQPKTGTVAIHRPNYEVSGLTLITCTKNNDSTQTIYIFEMI